MSRVVEQALEAVKHTEFRFPKAGRELEVRNAHLFWTNFEGRENNWGNKATTFNLAVPKDVADILDNMGWRVRDVKLKSREEGEEDVILDVLYFVNIKVNMKSSYPPIITTFTTFRDKKTRTTINEASLASLDRVEIETADCVVNMYESPKFPGKVTGYLKKLNLIIEPAVDFGGKYDDWMAEDYDETRLDMEE